MSSQSAYELLEQMQQTYGITTTESALFSDVLFHSVQQQRMTFVQFYENNEVQTQIATMSTPPSIDLNNQSIHIIEKMFANQELTLYQVKHCANTVSISYSNQLNAYCITTREGTIICQKESQIDQQIEPLTSRACEMAKYFFQKLNTMSPKTKQSLASDLTNRSLVGVSCFKRLYWFGIMEHYDIQKMLHHTVVRDFLIHYNLEQVMVVKKENVKFSDLEQLYNEVHNQYIENINDMHKDSTFYVWKEGKCLGSFHIPHKHYQIIETLRVNFRGNNQNPYAYLSNFDLSSSDIKFYKQYTDFMLAHRQQYKSITFSTLTSIAFNCIAFLKKFTPEKIGYRFSLAHCINPIMIVLIPVGIKNTGFEILFSQLSYCYPFVKLIKSTNNISIESQVYCLDQFYPPSQFNEINIQLKNNQNRIITIALFHDSLQKSFQKGNYVMPFSPSYLLSGLFALQSEQLLDTVKFVRQFNGLDLKKLSFDHCMSCVLLPRDQEMFIAQNNQLISSFENLLTNNQEEKILFQQLKEIDDPFRQVRDAYFREEGKNLLEQIESITSIELNRMDIPQARGENTQKKQQQSLIFIDNGCWTGIEDYICDCLEIIQRKFKKDNQVTTMFQQLDGQFFKKQTQYYQENTYNIQIETSLKNDFEVNVRLAIVVVDGLIILIPEDAKAEEGIPVYLKNLDLQHALSVVQQVRGSIDKLIPSTVADQSVQFEQIRIESKEWNVYIVKFPLKIKLVFKMR